MAKQLLLDEVKHEREWQDSLELKFTPNIKPANLNAIKPHYEFYNQISQNNQLNKPLKSASKP